MPSLKRAVLWTVVTFFAFYAVEASVFRSGFYARYLEPDSSTGMVENRLYWLRHTPPSPNPEVIVFGDSRLAEGFSASVAETATQHKIVFQHFGIPGMSVRNWYYLLRDADPGRNRFRAVVLAMETYNDDESFDNPPNRIRDLGYSLGRLRLTDCREFAMSMVSPENRQRALSGCVFKGLAFRPDIHEFLLNPTQRINDARAQLEHGLEWNNGYTGIPRDLAGLSADFEKREIHFPPGLDEGVKRTIRQSVTPDYPPDTGETTRYRQLWYGRILDLYHDTPVRLVFIAMPRAPLPVPEGKVPPRFIQSITGRTNVFIVPAETFRDFERPELFGDGLHLNSVGRLKFSARLANLIGQILGTK